MPAIQGVLCDLDGTLIDSEGLHLEAWNALLDRYHCHPPAAWSQAGIGFPDVMTRDTALALFPELATHGDILAQKQQLFREMVAARGSALVFPGVARRLQALAAAGFRLAVGTNSVSPNTRAAMTAAGLFDYLRVYVSLDMVANGKPFPDIYLEAARRLDLPPERCVVLEDSAAGVEAAKVAGCLAVGIANTVPADRLARADRVFASTPAAMDWLLAGFPPENIVNGPR
ncbi:MAG: HAD family phosphatase [Planctomycetes bacterium]|nr:HAD family phosphatase [Planctomycetota bacterium]